MARTVFPLEDVYGLLEPGPVVLLTTARDGVPNVMTLSWLTMIEFEPPLVGCVLSPQDHSFDALEATGEAVINLPSARIAKAVVGCGNTSGRDTDKFARFGLTPLPASKVSAPRIAECFAQLECRVVDRTLVSRYGLFVLEVLAAWKDPDLPDEPTLHHRGWGRFMLSGETVTLSSYKR